MALSLGRSSLDRFLHLCFDLRVILIVVDSGDCLLESNVTRVLGEIINERCIACLVEDVLFSVVQRSQVVKPFAPITFSSAPS
jgi:hypothetical protein